MDTQQLVEVTDVIWIGFKKLLPITMSHHSYGLVAASKILFAIFPEIVLPVDNAEWKLLFKTVDLSDVIKNMAQEIKKWEKMTGQQLTCNLQCYGNARTAQLKRNSFDSVR